MSKTRNKALNQTDRDRLLTFANSNIACPAEQAVFDAAYLKARAIVLVVVRDKYPPKDMKVLDKYKVARHDTCIRYGARYDSDSAFHFKDDDKDVPLVPGISDCSGRTYEWTAEHRSVLDEYQLAREALKKARKEKFDAYKRLVTGSRTFNDVVAVWPAAEALRDRIVPETNQQRALAVLSAEAIAMIRADNAGARVPA